MNQQKSQLDPNEAAASLAFATHLQDGMQMAMNPNQGQAENPQEQSQEGSQTQEKPQEGAEKPQGGDMQSQIKQALDSELSGIRDEIKKALSTEDPAKEEVDMKSMFEEFKKETQSTIKSEVDGIKQALKDSLND